MKIFRFSTLYFFVIVGLACTWSASTSDPTIHYKSLSLDGLRRELSRTERLGEGEIPFILIFPQGEKKKFSGFRPPPE